jgi:hypothetical protein
VPAGRRSVGVTSAAARYLAQLAERRGVALPELASFPASFPADGQQYAAIVIGRGGLVWAVGPFATSWAADVYAALCDDMIAFVVVPWFPPSL